MSLSSEILLTFFLSAGCAMFSIAQPDWKVDPYAFEFSMTITAKVTTDGNFSHDVNDRVAAFINGNCRGVSNVSFESQEEGCYVYLMVYSNKTTDSITFKIWDAGENKVYDVKRTLAFQINKIVGSVYSPFIISSANLNNKAEMLNFTIPDQVGETAVSGRNLVLQKSPNSSLTGIIASFSTSEGAKVFVKGIRQESGKSINDYSNPLPYTVVSADYSDTVVYTVYVLSKSDKPPVFISSPPNYVMQDEVYIYPVVVNDFEGDKVTVVVEKLPSWLKFNSDTWIISGIPHNEQVGTHYFKIKASDGIMETIQDVTIQVINKNDPPEIKSIFGNKVFFVNKENALPLPHDCITDPDVGDSLTFSLLMENNTALPDWLFFEPRTMTISGIPPGNAVGIYKLKLTATDRGKLKEWIVFELKVDLTSGLITRGKSIDFQIYPNPFRDDLFIHFPGNPKEFSISVFSEDGMTILQDLKKSGSLCKLSTESLIPGVYFIVVSMGQHKETRIVIKK